MFEKVSPKHPDKIADRIAGALVDLAYTKQENPRIAVEVLIGHGVCHIIAETSVSLPLDVVEYHVHRIISDVPKTPYWRRTRKASRAAGITVSSAERRSLQNRSC